MRVGDNLEICGVVHDHQAGVLVTLLPSFPCRILRWGITVHQDHFDSGSAVIQLLRTTHAADGTISEAAVGGAVLGITDTDYLEGSVLYAEPAEGPDNEIIVKPGDSIDLDMTTGGTAGDIVGFIQYQQLNWDETGDNANYSDATPTNRLTDLST